MNFSMADFVTVAWNRDKTLDFICPKAIKYISLHSLAHTNSYGVIWMLDTTLPKIFKSKYEYWEKHPKFKYKFLTTLEVYLDFALKI
jgi:hypothetical protein